MASVGQVLNDRYRLVELLGEGGMATIYRAHDQQLGRDVAVKVLRAEYGRDQAFVARFRQEAQAAAALNHPNVVNVFDYGMEDGDPYIVMELVEGGDLAEVMRERGALEPVAAARIAQQVADALDAAHGRGIVHRDIKTTNVLITRGGRIKVGDFGIARAFAEAQITMPGTTLGSVHYFSPEQARGELVTSASDIYSLGLVLFEMLTGRRAWTGDSAGAVAVARLAGDPPAPSSIQPGVPAALDAIVKAALARVPGDRPTAGDLSAALGRFINDPAAPAVLAPAARREGVAGAPSPTAGAAAAGAPGAAGAGAAGAAMADGGPYDPAYGTFAGRGRGGRPPMAYRPPDEDEDDGGGPWGWIAAILGVLVLLAGGVLAFLLLSGPRGGAPATTPTPGLVEVPSLVGRPLGEARQLTTTAGLVFTVSGYEQTDAQPEETILEQSLPAGEPVTAGSELSVVVATQRATVAVPDLRSRTEAELVSILLESNLIPGARSEAYDPEVPASLVIRTNPRFGVEVARDTVVDYVVSLGPPPTPSPSPTPTEPPTPTPSPPPTEPPTPPPPPTEPPTPTPSPPPTPSPSPSPSPITVGNYETCGPVSEAIVQIEQAGLRVGLVWPPEHAENGIVDEQDPAPGTEVPPGTDVHLLVRGPGDPCDPS